MLIYRCGDHILNVDGKPDAILFFFFLLHCCICKRLLFLAFREYLFFLLTLKYLGSGIS